MHLTDEEALALDRLTHATGKSRRAWVRDAMRQHVRRETLRPLHADLGPQAHAELDRAVAAAYGWPEDPATLADDEVLRRLLALNLSRAAA